MSNLQAKLKLVGQTFLFGEKFALRKGREVVVDVSKLNIADLEIIANQIKYGIIESNVSADKFLERSLELRQKVSIGDVDEVYHLQIIDEVRVLDAEIELEDGTVTTQAQLDEEAKADPRKDFVREKIIDAPGSVALVAIKNIPDVDLEILQFALATEIASKNRKTVVSAISSEIEELSAPKEVEIEDEE